MRLRPLALAGATLALALAPFAQAGAADPIHYVAMGDSYSAASGVLPLTADADAVQCTRSLLNYGHRIASATGASYSDVTCGGAQTKDFFESQTTGVAPQLDAVTGDTDLVTMTIGGNDSGVFINAIADCGAAGATTLGFGSPCKDKYGSSFEDTIKNVTYPALVKALAAVHAKAPKATVAILSYPWITPPDVSQGRCYPQLPVADGDVPYLHQVQATLNDAVARAAKATHSTYVDLGPASTGHDACKSVFTRWIEPVVTTTNPVIVHPNAYGEQRMAEETLAQLRLP